MGQQERLLTGLEPTRPALPPPVSPPGVRHSAARSGGNELVLTLSPSRTMHSSASARSSRESPRIQIHSEAQSPVSCLWNREEPGRVCVVYDFDLTLAAIHMFRALMEAGFAARPAQLGADAIFGGPQRLAELRAHFARLREKLAYITVLTHSSERNVHEALELASLVVDKVVSVNPCSNKGQDFQLLQLPGATSWIFVDDDPENVASVERATRGYVPCVLVEGEEGVQASELRKVEALVAQACSDRWGAESTRAGTTPWPRGDSSGMVEAPRLCTVSSVASLPGDFDTSVMLLQGLHESMLARTLQNSCAPPEPVVDPPTSGEMPRSTTSCSTPVSGWGFSPRQSLLGGHGASGIGSRPRLGQVASRSTMASSAAGVVSNSPSLRMGMVPSPPAVRHSTRQPLRHPMLCLLNTIKDTDGIDLLLYARHTVLDGPSTPVFRIGSPARVTHVGTDRRRDSGANRGVAKLPDSLRAR